ncbi:hypothetical protein ABIC89_000846 [Variovorax boronicumulans]|uniref:AAA family ATPase n=1 Tax=Variovorax boronicumulans TaxID=436515 RepID=UPI003391FA7A
MSALDVFDQMAPDQAPPRPKRQRPAAAAAAPSVAPLALPDGVVLTRASTVKVTPVRWLWQDWLAQGKVHLLAGAPGQGKTTIALAFAATVSAGGRWPDGRSCPPGDVLVWSGEDDPADTLAPRLMAMGANLERVHFVEAARIDGELLPFDPARDMLALHAAADQIGDVRLLVVDPIVSATPGRPCAVPLMRFRCTERRAGWSRGGTGACPKVLKKHRRCSLKTMSIFGKS